MMDHIGFFVTGFLAICTGLLVFALVAVLVESGLLFYSVIVVACCYVVGLWVDGRFFQ